MKKEKNIILKNVGFGKRKKMNPMERWIIMLRDPICENQLWYINNDLVPFVQSGGFHPFRRKINGEHYIRKNQTIISLVNYGFEKPKRLTDIIKKTVAYPTSGLQSDMISFFVDDLERNDYGLRVYQKAQETLFHKDEDVTKQKIEELFIPYYLFPFIFVNDNDNLFEANKDYVNNKHYKKYLPESKIKTTEPSLFQRIVETLETKRIPNFDELAENISRYLHLNGLDNNVRNRIKNVEGVYSKLGYNGEKLTVEEIYDINGISIEVDTPSECYDVLEKVNKIFPIRFYWEHIAEPKPNGFQCLTAQTHPFLSLEIQIRTYNMYEVAEMGSASDYRGGEYSIHSKKHKNVRGN